MRAVRPGFALFALLANVSRFTEATAYRRAIGDSPAHTIPVYRTENGQYIAAATMGDQPQHLNFTFSGSLPYIVVAGSDCTTCNTSAKYDPSKSPSFKPGVDKVIPVGGDAMMMKTGRENCSFIQSDGTSWDYLNQTVAVLSAPPPNSTLFSGDSSGIVGLGTSFVSNFSDSFLGGWLSKNPTATNVSVGLAFGLGDSTGPPSASPTPAGNFYFLGGDHSASSLTDQKSPPPFKGSLVKIPAQTINTTVVAKDGSDILSTTDWAVSLNSWTFSSGNTNTSGGQGHLALIEPGFTSLVLPLNDTKVLIAALSATEVETYNSDVISYTVPCTQLFGFTLNFNGITFELDRHTLVQQNGTTCNLAIQCWSDPTIGTYVLGTPFLQNAFVVFTASQKDSSDGHTFSFGQLNQYTEEPSNHTGAIVGGTLGGVAFLVILGFVVYYFINRSRSQQTKKSAPDLEPRPMSYAAYGAAPLTPTSDLPSLPNSATSDTPFLSLGSGKHLSSTSIPPGYDYDNPPPEADFGPRFVDMWISRTPQGSRST